MRLSRDELEERICLFVNSYVEQNRVYPSYREIAIGIGYSTGSSIFRHIKRMEGEGKLDVNGRRGVSTRAQRTSVARVPLVGSVACGLPILAEQNIEEYIPILQSELGNGEFFALRAHGDSMVNAGIEDGELVFVRKQDTAEDGDIVVALIDDEATLKYYFRDYKKHKIILRPANVAYNDMIFDEIVIQGKAVKVLKNL